MSTLSDITLATLQHAYLIEGEAAAEDSALAFIEKFTGRGIESNPDVYRVQSDTFGVDEARALREHLSLKPVGPLSVALVSCSLLTNEAQNALLKVLEDPPTASCVFLIVPSKARILPTLRSRMEEIQAGHVKEARASFTQEFLEASPAKRLEMAKEIAEAKDRARARSLVRGVIVALHERLTKGEEVLAAVLEDIESTTRFLEDPSVSLKLILEHLALTAPRMP